MTRKISNTSELYEASPIDGISKTTYSVSVASALNDTAGQMVLPVLPLFLSLTLGASPLAIGAIEGVAGAISNAFTLLVGVMSDKSGKRASFVFTGYGVSAMARVFLFLAFNWWFVLVLRVIDRFGRAVRSASRDAMISESVPNNLMARNFGFYNSADNLGAFVGPIIASVVLFFFPNDFRKVFLFAVPPSIVALLVLSRLKSKNILPEDHARKLIGFKNYQNLPTEFYTMMFVNIFFSLGNSSDSFIVLRAQQLGLPNHFLPLIASIVALAAALCAYPSGLLTEKIGAKQTVLIGFACYILTYVGLAFLKHIGVGRLWPILVVYGGMGVISGAIKPLTMGLVNKSLRGTASGIMLATTGFASLLGNLLAGYAWAMISPDATFFLGAGFVALAGVLLVTHSRRIHS